MNLIHKMHICLPSPTFWLCALLSLSAASHSDNRQEGAAEFSFYIPYAHAETIDFKGGAEANLKDNIGFGFAMAYNVNERVAARFDIDWVRQDYTGKRIIDDDPIEEQKIRSRLDTFRMSLGGDFYFMGEQNISPFISGSIGWEFLDTNIPIGPPNTACWWDPWWGYICQNYQNTYTDSNWFYGAGLGIRVAIGRNNFARLGYYETRSSLNNTESTPRFAVTRFEFGWTY